MYHCMYIYDVYIFFYPFESVIFETVGMQMPFARSLENDTFKRVNELDFISQSQILQKKLFLVNMKSMCEYILTKYILFLNHALTKLPIFLKVFFDACMSM